MLLHWKKMRKMSQIKELENAQELSGDLREKSAELREAKAEAEKVVKEANAQASEILGNINRKVTHESLVYEMVQKEASEFKSKLVAMYKDHINLINKLPEIVDEQLDAEEKAAEEKAEPVEETVEELHEDVAVEDDDIVVIEEPQVVIEDDEPEQTEVEEPAVIQEVQEPDSAVKEEKKPFKIDLSKIDFADDEEDDAPAQTLFENFEVVDSEDEDDDGDDSQSMSFRNFFKKK